MELFGSSCVNAGRQLELDWARGLAVLFMVSIHVAERLVAPPPGIFFHCLTIAGGPLAAPAFMLLLGMGIVYSKNSSPKKLAMRGLSLIGLHYALNICAFGAPNLLMYAKTADTAYLTECFAFVFEIDILAFAGMAFLLFALKEKFSLKTFHLVLFALVTSCLNILLTKPVDNNYLGVFLGLFARINERSYFPFFSWISYPIIGYIFGNLLKSCTNKNVLYQRTLIISSLIVLCLALNSVKYDFNIWYMYFENTDEYYFQDFFQYILVSGIVFSWISILYFLTKVKFFQLFNGLLTRWSRNVTIIYCAQWLILGWIFVPELTDFPESALIMISASAIVMALSDASAALYRKMAARRG